MAGIRYWQPSDLALLEQDATEAYKREVALAWISQTPRV